MTRKLLEETKHDALDESDKQLVHEQVRSVYSILRNAVSTEWTSQVRSDLAKIFRDAQEFYRIVYMQQSHIEVAMPYAIGGDGAPVAFDPKRMEAVDAEEDESALAGKPVEVTVFPAVYKIEETCNVSVSIDQRRLLRLKLFADMEI